MPALEYTGRSQTFEMPGLAYVGTQPPDSVDPASGGLEIISLPTGRRQSVYLSIEDATVARDQTLRIHYTGLPEQRGTITLFYMGGKAPRRAAWFYTSARKADGQVERSGGSLPAYTGPWKACIGFQPDMPASAASPDLYADCVDFTLAGTGSRAAQPALSVSPARPLAGRGFVVHWTGFPPVNASIALIDTSTGRRIARRTSSSEQAGDWQVTVGEAGSYEFRIYFEGDAVRARMPLEVGK